MKFTPRLKLRGKRATAEQIENEISHLVCGKGSRPYPINSSEIAKTLGISRTTVYYYLNRLKEQGTISKKDTGRFDLPKSSEYLFRYFNKDHPITSEPLVAEWMDDLITRRGGEPISNWRSRIRAIESVCNSCHICPSDLLVSQRNTEKILRQYAQLVREKKIHRDNRGKPTNNVHITMYNKVQAVRDFCGFYEITWRRGVSGIMSQKVPNHGLYADLRLTEPELVQADCFIKEQFGIDSDIYRWFWIGIESCARFEALYGMNLDYEKHINPKTNKTTYIMTAYESKTKYLRGGKWYKYITRLDTQKSIDLLKSRDGSSIYEYKLTKEKFRKKITGELSLVYKSLGKTNQYFYHHPNHSLRHIGAHYWLSKKDYNYGLVAEIGGWHTIDELKKSYGQIPPERILELIEN